MIGDFQIRTDLALEARESCGAMDAKIRGVRVEQHSDEENEIYTTTVIIETENGAKIMGKPVGTYITIEAPNLSSPDEGYHREVSEKLAEYLKRLMDENWSAVLVAGLGNREVTPDALGPEVVGNLNITRHMLREYGRMPRDGQKTCAVSAVAPGVTAQTGMETLEILRGVVHETKPDLVVAIDALAARSTKRLNRTIQVTDTGINPGSGVGNHRNAINEKTLGVPVIAVGVPTVVDAATIVNDTLTELTGREKYAGMTQKSGELPGILNRAEERERIRGLISPQLNTMFVTPKDIDETVKYLSYTIAEALNMAFSGENV